MSRIWQRSRSTPLADHRIFRVREDVCRSPRTGRSHTFYLLEARDWVNIIPITEDGQVVCIRQWRPGTNRVELEIPGGVIDEGESPADAASREMQEETGYTSRRLVRLGSMAPNPAILENRCHFFLAPDARPELAQSLDNGEDIEVNLVAVGDIPRLIQEGAISHGITIAAFFFYDMYRNAGNHGTRGQSI